ncbi:Hsp20/alpha crystallin family protein [Nocardiopsis nanhaiensis]
MRTEMWEVAMARGEKSRYNPFTGVVDFVSEMNRIADHMHGLDSQPEWEARSHANAWVPSVDIAVFGDQLVIYAGLSGVDEQDIEVSFVEPYLTIAGQRRLRDGEHELFSYYTKELSWGRFRRSIALAQGVHSEDIEVAFADGLLRVTVHRYTQAAGPAQLPVNKAPHPR